MLYSSEYSRNHLTEHFRRVTHRLHALASSKAGILGGAARRGEGGDQRQRGPGLPLTSPARTLLSSAPLSEGREGAVISSCPRSHPRPQVTQGARQVVQPQSTCRQPATESNCLQPPSLQPPTAAAHTRPSGPDAPTRTPRPTPADGGQSRNLLVGGFARCVHTPMTQLLPVARARLSSHQWGLENRKQEVFRTGNEALLQGPECSGNPAEKGLHRRPAGAQGGGRWGRDAGHSGSTPGGPPPDQDRQLL